MHKDECYKDELAYDRIDDIACGLTVCSCGIGDGGSRNRKRNCSGTGMFRSMEILVWNIRGVHA